ncbi:AbrB family transcriptional regulator [Planomicrobium sp. YIM 101495]|uniref:AbrB family transcriptional regulator n=1 Tax=Planomicrobium sp. YIM 101495 TaxID=2665160 RepID=UPI0012BA2524|nr:AbrB family transcriptional regulator [Planomicrobium sp. YIM 101495]MTD31893.1 AbrB family transcriptional regulator [Planomicrobium sp. YIM 101495]
MLKVLVLSLIGGFLFSRLHISIPWMLGPIVFVMLVQFVYKGPLRWSGKLRDIGIVMVATMIGVQFNIELFGMLGSLLFYMLTLNLILIGGSIGIAFCANKWAKIPMKAALLGSIPGGLGQILIFAEEENIKEIGIITYLQVIRLLLVVVLVPFIVAGQTMGSAPSDANLTVSLVLLTGAAWVCGYAAKRIRMPVAFFIAPIILLITLQLTTPLAMPEVPGIFMITAQLLIGAHIGLMLKPHMVKLPLRVLIAGIASALALIILTFGSSFIMSFAMDTSFATSFLSTAPGGLDQMVLLAEDINADVSFVSMFQTFRLLFIFTLVMPLLKLFYRWRGKKEALLN